MLTLADDDDISLPDIFSDEKILSKSPNTPTTRSKQSPAKSKSAKSETGTPNGLPSPSKPAPRNSFNAKLQAITDKTKEKKEKETTKEQHLSENITVNGTTKSKPPPKGPKKQELDEIKEQVLAKLCGRTPIPLQGHPAEVATYLSSSSQF